MKLALVAILSLAICGCQSTPDPRIADLENQVATLKAQNAQCNAKFDRATILYDVGLFNNETRAWVIPADVEPVLAGNKTGTYSHYDPKTQTETLHFKGKPAQ